MEIKLCQHGTCLTAVPKAQWLPAATEMRVSRAMPIATLAFHSLKKTIGKKRKSTAFKPKCVKEEIDDDQMEMSTARQARQKVQEVPLRNTAFSMASDECSIWKRRRRYTNLHQQDSKHRQPKSIQGKRPGYLSAEYSEKYRAYIKDLP